MKTGDHSWKGHVALLAANIIWGLNAPIGKEALAVVSMRRNIIKEKTLPLRSIK
jgi:hypothetical protein